MNKLQVVVPGGSIDLFRFLTSIKAGYMMLRLPLSSEVNGIDAMFLDYGIEYRYISPKSISLNLLTRARA